MRAALLALFLAGCAGPLGYHGLDAGQIKEIVKDKESSVVALCAASPWTGPLKVVLINTDKGIYGSVHVKGQCDDIQLDTTVKPPLAPKP